jgi:hypothetical protein
MSVVAIIEDVEELAKIIEWAKKQEQESLLSVCARSPPEPALVAVENPEMQFMQNKIRSQKRCLHSAMAELCPWCVA